MKYIIVVFIGCFFLSCHRESYGEELDLVLEKSGSNRDELVKVLKYFSKDSLKYEAAKFLILNMRGKYSHSYSKLYNEAFDKADEKRKELKNNFPEYSLSKITSEVNDLFVNEIKRIESTNSLSSPILKNDLECISSEDLIENIELAFFAHKQIPIKLCKNNNDFFNYVLPYRSGSEPYESGKRKELLQQFNWVFDSLKVAPLNKVVSDIYKQVELCSDIWNNYAYPGVPSISQMEKTKFGPCNYVTNYFISVLRSVGIPSGRDYTDRWGINYNSLGHKWVFYLTEDNFEAIDIGVNNNYSLKRLYQYTSIPMIEREAFDTIINITNTYKKTFDLDIPVIFDSYKGNDNASISLCVYDNIIGWDRVMQPCKINDDEVSFCNVGGDVLYLVKNQITEEPLNYPFYLDNDGTISFYKPSFDKDSVKAIITRKYPPFLINHKKQKQYWKQSLNNYKLKSIIKDEEPSKEIVLSEILNFNTTQLKTYFLKKSEESKIYRFESDFRQNINISNFNLLDEKGNILELDKNYNSENVVKVLSDSNPLTFLNVNDLKITYEFDKKQKISGFSIQARNDDNHIKINDVYELFYWDKEWISLGRQQAKDTLLQFKALSNSLLLLKNHTRGREEFPFTLDSINNQNWLGITKYQDLNIYSMTRLDLD